jgi:predicted transposase/invertase (TIGR01784 family)
MRTDSIFYNLFQEYPEIFFELTDQGPAEAEHYRFRSEEVKESQFRIDGVFEPLDALPGKPVYFTEVQFWDNPKFYWKLFAEVFIFLEKHMPESPWKAVALFGHAGLDPGVPLALRPLQDECLRVVYLDQWAEQHPGGSIGLRMVKLIVESEETASEDARSLVADVKSQADDPAARAALRTIETILVYKFPHLRREEIEAMFQLADIKETMVYKEALEEGKKEGKEEGKKEGLREGKLRAVPALIKRGLSVEETARELGLAVKAVRDAAARLKELPEH